MQGIYVRACPNCGGPIDDNRLYKGLVCTKCLPISPEEITSRVELAKKLKRLGNLKDYKKVIKIERELMKIERIFKKATGSSLWSSQRVWARRVLKGRSFSIVAPTGVGKTVFGMIIAIYFANKGFKSYIILPTTPLVLQVEERIIEMSRNSGLLIRVLAVHSKLSRSEYEGRLEKLSNGDFDILITTAHFLRSRIQLLLKNEYRFVFVDDVDAVLKSSKSIDAVLKVLGFTDEELELGMSLYRIKIRLAKVVSSGNEEELITLQREYQKLSRRLRKVKRRIKSILVVSSATGRPRGTRVKLFKELLGFETGSRSETLRNIVDSFKIPKLPLEEEVASIILKLGTGGLVFVPIDKGIEYAEKLAEVLRKSGIIAEAFHSKRIKVLKEFADGNIDVLIGVATYYGVLTRGLDLPERVRYTIFAGVPRFKFSIHLEEPHPITIARILSLISEVAPEHMIKKLEILSMRIRKALQRLSPMAILMIYENLKSGRPPESLYEKLFYEALVTVRKALARTDILERLESSGEIALVRENGKLYIMLPDVMTYIQASGRASRLYAGGITKAISVVIVDDIRLLKGLIRRSKWIIEDIDWRPLEEINLEKLIEDIDRDRRNVIKARKGEVGELKGLTKTALLIVESPNKARTIANFFGRPSVRIINDVLRVYEVSTGEYVLLITASGGHVYDLIAPPEPGKPPLNLETIPGITEALEFHGVLKINNAFIPIYSSIKRCLACGHQFTAEVNKCPRCGSKTIRDAHEVLEAIRELASEVDEVFIGTDPDTEGEKIGWDLMLFLKPYVDNIKRIEFHEVTRKAILRALKEAREFDRRLIEAQIVRRIEDRWIGFTLSPLLWYDFWPNYCRERFGEDERCKRPNMNLSAGRVQTPVLGWIIERYKEHLKNITQICRIDFKDFSIELSGDECINIEPGKEALVKELGIEDIEVKPSPPFTTDTYLSEVSTRLKISTPEAMKIAQDLFEMGLITYHRTDSTRISEAGITVAREYLQEVYGDDYKKVFAPKPWGTGGAHEGIRPTRAIDSDRLKKLIEEGIITLPKPLTRRHLAVYDIIFRRFIASQMIPGKIKIQKIKVIIGKVIRSIERKIEVLEPGFLEIYMPFKIEKKIVPGVYEISNISIVKKSLTPLYTQGDVVRLMKERGIGRPSTYAIILDRLLDRKYVSESRKLKKLIPTQLGIKVYKYLSEKFSDIVSEERTAIIEKLMNEIELGLKDYQKILNEFYEEIKEISSKVLKIKTH